jgi:CHAD domain-containing protein
MPVLSKASKDEFDSPVERLLASVANLRQRPTSKGAHFYRTSLRRFQAWSDVFHPHIDAEQKLALKFLNRLRKATGKLRDSEVHRGLLDQLVDVNAKQKRQLETELKSGRKASRKKLKTLLRDSMLTHLWRMLRALDEPSELDEKAESHPIAGMHTLALDEYRAYIERRGPLSLDNLHEYRLQCKRFRYIAELAGDTPGALELVHAWKNVQDVIGEWHDYLTLSELAQELLGNSQLYSSLVELRDKKQAKSIAAVEDTERKLMGKSPVLKKRPRRAPSRGQSSSAA